MEKEYYKRKILKPLIITIIIVALLASFTYFVVIRKVNYNLGERYYLGKLYPEAIQKLKPLGDYDNSYSLYIRSLYRQGKQYFDSYNYILAIKYFEDLAVELPGTQPLVDDCKFMMAVTEGAFGRFGECLIMLNKFDDFPDYDRIMEAAVNRDQDFFIFEYKTHRITMELKDVINVYINKE